MKHGVFRHLQVCLLTWMTRHRKPMKKKDILSCPSNMDKLRQIVNVKKMQRWAQMKKKMKRNTLRCLCNSTLIILVCKYLKRKIMNEFHQHSWVTRQDFNNQIYHMCAHSLILRMWNRSIFLKLLIHSRYQEYIQCLFHRKSQLSKMIRVNKGLILRIKMTAILKHQVSCLVFQM